MDENGAAVSTQSFGYTCGLAQVELDMSECVAETMSPSSSPSHPPSSSPILKPVTASPTTASTASPETGCSIAAKKVKLESTTGEAIAMFEIETCH